MQSLPLTGLVIISDTVECKGEPLLAHFIRKANGLKKFLTVELLLYEAPKKCMVNRYPLLENDRINVREMFDSPFDLPGMSAELERTVMNLSANSIVFLDSMSRFHLNSMAIFDPICALFHRLAKKFPIVTVIHSDVLNDQLAMQRLLSIADCALQLSVLDGKSLCKLTNRRKAGKIAITKELFTVNPIDLRLESVKFVPTPIGQPAVNKKPPADFAVTFDMGLQLRDGERPAKAQVVLPYTDAQKKEGGLVSIHKRPGVAQTGGRIYYEYDRGDDIDEEDPDDDLGL